MITLTQAEISAVAGGIGAPESAPGAFSPTVAGPKRPQERPEGTVGSGGDIEN